MDCLSKASATLPRQNRRHSLRHRWLVIYLCLSILWSFRLCMSNREVSFVSAYWNNSMGILGVNLHPLSAFYTQQNEQAEVTNWGSFLVKFN